MRRLVRVDSKDVKRYDETDLGYYNDEGRPVRLLADDIMDDNSIVVVVYHENTHRETVHAVRKDYAFYIDGNEPFKDCDMTVAETEDGCIVRGCVWIDNGEEGVSFRFLVDEDWDVRYNMTEKLAWIRHMCDKEREELSGKLREYKADNALILMDKTKEIHEFKPFDKVLVRDKVGKEWEPAIFFKGPIEDSPYPYRVIANYGMGFKQCIPYEGNEELAYTDFNNMDELRGKKQEETR